MTRRAPPPAETRSLEVDPLAWQAKPPCRDIVGTGGNVCRREGFQLVPPVGVLELDAEPAGRRQPHPHEPGLALALWCGGRGGSVA